MLSRAIELLAANDEANALRALLDAWRAERLPAIADLIDLLSAQVTRGLAPITAKTVAERTSLWDQIEQARDPCDVERLLATPWPGRWQDCSLRLERVAEWPDDPRVAMALARLIDEAPYDSAGAAYVYEAALERIAHLGDVRALATLGKKDIAARPSSYRRSLAHEERYIVHRLSEIALPSPSDPRSLAKLRELFGVEIRRRASSKKNESDLLHAIYEAPGDDDLRQVYADVLSERGDPRGEFITLQLAHARGEATEAMRKRERALLTKHAKEWMGTLYGWREEDNGESTQFERGFLSGFRLSWHAGENILTALSDPAWATIHTLDVRKLGHSHLANMASTDVFQRRVRALHAMPEHVVITVHGDQPVIPLTNIEELGIRFDYPASDRRVLGDCTAFPGLRRLLLHVERADHDSSWLFRGDVWKRLTGLTVGPTTTYTPWLIEARKKTSLESMSFFMGGVTFGRWDTRFSHEPLDTDRFSAAHLHFEGGVHRAHNVMSELGDILRQLAKLPNIRKVVIDPARALKPKLTHRVALEEAAVALEKAHQLVLDVPWERLSTTSTETQKVNVATALGVLQLNLIGETPSVTRFVDSLTPFGLNPSYDMFAVNYGLTRDIGNKGLARVLAWAEKDSTQIITLLRDGMRNQHRLRIQLPGRYAYRQRPDPRIVGYPCTATELLMRIEQQPNDAEGRAFAAAFLQWLLVMVDAFDIRGGTARLSTAAGTPLEILSDVGVASFGWINILAEHHEVLFPREELAKLPAILGDDAVAVHMTKRNVILVTSALPSAVLTASAMERWNEALTEIFLRAFRKRYGWDPESFVASKLDEPLAAMGFAPTVKTRSVVGYTRQRDTVTDGFFVQLSSTLAYPSLRVLLATTNSASQTGPAAYWPARFPIENPDHALQLWPATTREQAACSLASILGIVRSAGLAWLSQQTAQSL